MARKPRYPRVSGSPAAKAQGRSATAAVSITDELLGGVVIDELVGGQLVRKDA